MSDRISEIRDRLEKATPGPWYWRNTNHDIYLLGHNTNAVMTFARMGMQGAQPEFRVGARLEPSKGRNLYDFPDAAFIANATIDVAWLLSEVERLRAKNRELNRRCTKAEAFVGKTVDKLRAAPGFAGFGRALANWAAENERRKSDERAARAWDKGYGRGREDGYNDRLFHGSIPRPPKSSRNPYRRKETT